MERKKRRKKEKNAEDIIERSDCAVRDRIKLVRFLEKTSILV